MKTWKVTAIATLALGGCAPAHLVKPPAPTVPEQATSIVVYREPAFLSMAGTAIFGVDGQDYVELWNKEVYTTKIPAGTHDFFVRSMGADRPNVLTIDAKPGRTICFSTRANPALYGMMWIPFSYYFSHAYLIERIKCAEPREGYTNTLDRI